MFENFVCEKCGRVHEACMCVHDATEVKVPELNLEIPKLVMPYVRTGSRLYYKCLQGSHYDVVKRGGTLLGTRIHFYPQYPEYIEEYVKAFIGIFENSFRTHPAVYDDGGYIFIRCADIDVEEKVNGADALVNMSILEKTIGEVDYKKEYEASDFADTMKQRQDFRDGKIAMILTTPNLFGKVEGKNAQLLEESFVSNPNPKNVEEESEYNKTKHVILTKPGKLYFMYTDDTKSTVAAAYSLREQPGVTGGFQMVMINAGPGAYNGFVNVYKTLSELLPELDVCINVKVLLTEVSSYTVSDLSRLAMYVDSEMMGNIELVTKPKMMKKVKTILNALGEDEGSLMFTLVNIDHSLFINNGRYTEPMTVYYKKYINAYGTIEYCLKLSVNLDVILYNPNSIMLEDTFRNKRDELNTSIYVDISENHDLANFVDRVNGRNNSNIKFITFNEEGGRI